MIMVFVEEVVNFFKLKLALEGNKRDSIAMCKREQASDGSEIRGIATIQEEASLER